MANTTLTTQKQYDSGFNPTDESAINSKKAQHVGPCSPFENPWKFDSIEPVDTYESPDGIPSAPTKRAHSQLEILQASICKEIDDILANSDNDPHAFEKMQKVAHRYFSILSHQNSGSQHDFIKEMYDQTMEYAEKIRRTYNTWPNLVCSLVGASLSIAGGAVGVAPIFGNFSEAMVKTLSSVGTGLGSAGNGVGMIGGVFKEREQAKRDVLQIYLRLIETQHSDRKQAQKENEQAGKRALEGEKELNQARSRIFDTATGAA